MRFEKWQSFATKYIKHTGPQNMTVLIVSVN
jgi:hypothetical protein